MSPEEDVPYRSPVSSGPAKNTSVQDEADYSTLLNIKKELDVAVANLSKDFNAFNLSKNVPELAVQVAGRQLAYDILTPLQTRVDSIINDIKVANKGA